MSITVSEQLPLLAAAPNGIRKLRELILELAVRGKLVAQDASDEPASELLKRIAMEKKRLVAEGKIKQQKPLAKIADEEKMFALPHGWEWQRFAGFALDVSTGPFGSLIHQSDYVDGGVPLVNPSHMIEGRIAPDYSVSLSPEMAESMASYRLSAGDMVMARRGEVGRVALVTETEDGWLCGTGSFVLRFTPEISRSYIWTLFRCNSVRAYLAGAAVGTTMVNLNHGILLKMPIAVPPLAEQHRIVAKVDELMALCDQLETQQAGAESVHAQLVAALLDSLTQAIDADDFAISWQRLSAHFHTLFTTESSINALKQTLLQLAVMGKLVSQDSSDEPVHAFLRQHGIKAEPHTLHGWASVALGHFGEILGGSTPSKANAEFWEGDIPWVSPKDMKRPLIDDAEDHITFKALQSTSLKLIPSNSLLMVVRGMILAHSFPVALTAREVTINQDMKALMPPAEISAYLLMYLQAAKSVMVGLVDRSSHGTCKLISEKLWSHSVSVPPLTEQHRIVAKVDQLMALCDQLSAAIQRRNQHSRYLADALVDKALSSAPKTSTNVVDLSCYLVDRLVAKPTFGRTTHMKLIYLADTHLGFNFQGNYMREAAGPLDLNLYQVEKQAEANGWYTHTLAPLKSGVDKVTYHTTDALAAKAQEVAEALGGKRQELDRLIALLGDRRTEELEIVATLFAAWNDALLDGQSPSDDWIIREVRENWHVKKQRFTAEKLGHWLDWMRKHHLVPTGKPPRTQQQVRMFH